MYDHMLSVLDKPTEDNPLFEKDFAKKYEQELA